MKPIKIKVIKIEFKEVIYTSTIQRIICRLFKIIPIKIYDFTIIFECEPVISSNDIILVNREIQMVCTNIKLAKGRVPVNEKSIIEVYAQSVEFTNTEFSHIDNSVIRIGSAFNEFSVKTNP
jgi:hypothetical protein